MAACGSSEQLQLETDSSEQKVRLPGSSSYFLERLWLMTQTGGGLADVTVEFGDSGRQEAHSVVLAAVSPFFEAMLTTDMVERRNHVVRLPTITQTTFNRVLAFTLGREVEVNMGSELEELLQAADLLLLTSLTAACGQALLQCLCPASCLRCLQLSVHFRLQQVLDAVEEYVALCLETASLEGAWLELGEGEVAGVVRAGARVGVDGDTMMGALLRWVGDTGTRGDTASRLLGLVALEDLSDDFLCDTLLFHPSVAGCSDLCQRARETVKTRLSSGVSRQKQQGLESRSAAAIPSNRKSVSRRETTGSEAEDAVIMLGSSEKNAFVCAWMVKDRIWVSLPAPPEYCSLSATALYQGSIFVTGGWPETLRKATQILSLKEMTWKRGPDMHAKRYNHDMVVVADSVYVAGGSREYLRSIEKFSSKVERWMTVGKLKVGVENCGLGTVGNLLLVVGGNGELGQNDLIQTFNTLTNTAAVAARRVSPQWGSMHYIGTQGKTYFLAQKTVWSKSQIVGFAVENDDVTEVSAVVLEGDARNHRAGTLFDGCILTCDSKSSVSHVLDGKRRETCEVPVPPRSMDVWAVVPTKL